MKTENVVHICTTQQPTSSGVKEELDDDHHYENEIDKSQMSEIKIQ